MFYTVLRDIENKLSEFNETDMYPSDYQGTIRNQREFCRYTVLPSNSQVYSNSNDKLVTGMLIIDIFTEAGKGQARAAIIAEELNAILEKKLLSNKTELGVSYLNNEGLDSANQSLSRDKYIIPFKLYGE